MELVGWQATVELKECWAKGEPMGRRTEVESGDSVVGKWAWLPSKSSSSTSTPSGTGVVVVSCTWSVSMGTGSGVVYGSVVFTGTFSKSKKFLVCNLRKWSFCSRHKSWTAGRNKRKEKEKKWKNFAINTALVLSSVTGGCAQRRRRKTIASL